MTQPPMNQPITSPVSTRLARSIADKIYAISPDSQNGPGDVGIVRRQAQIAAFDASTHSCSIYIGGGSDALPGVQYLDTYHPVVGDIVWVDIKGYNPLVIGSHMESAWVPWSPTLSSSFTVATGTTYARYKRMGQTVHVAFDHHFGGASPSAGSLTVSKPFQQSAGMPFVVGSMFIADVSSGNRLAGNVWADKNQTTFFMSWNDSICTDVFPTLGWASGDVIAFSITYEVAAGV